MEAYEAWGGSSLRFHQRKSKHLLIEFDFVTTENMRVSQKLAVLVLEVCIDSIRVLVSWDRH